LTDPVREAEILGPPVPPPCLDRQHESLKAAWWPGEFFPKFEWREDVHKQVLAIGAGRHRRIFEGELVHACALQRLREKADYRPPNLSPAFVSAVLALPTVPDVLPYAPDGQLAKTV